MSDDKNNGFTHQDWKPVVFKKTQKQLQKENPNKYKTQKTVKKNSKPNSNSTQPLKKFTDDDPESLHIKKVSLDLRKQIQQARTAKKMTQKDLANKLCVPVTTIQNYENGKAIPNGAFIAKIGRVLGVKLKKEK